MTVEERDAAGAAEFRVAPRSTRGMATVELALISLIVAGAALTAFWLVAQVLVVDRCQVVAHQVARQTARGDEAAVRFATEQAPPGADVRVEQIAGATRVTVTWRPTWQGIALTTVESSATVLNEARP